MTRWRGWARIALEAIAVLGLLSAAHLALDMEPCRVPDYGMPDSLFYSFGGLNLAAGRGYSVNVSGVDLPPKFPPGTSVLLAAGYAAGARTRAEGLVITHLLAGLLGLLTWLAARRLGGAWAGLGALAALQGSLYLTATRNQMASDVPACLAVLLLALLLARPRPGGRRLFAAGLLAGFGLWLRYPLIVAAPCLVLAIEPWRRAAARRAALLLLGALLPIGALLAWHWAAFGHPFRTGYGLWLPDFHQAAQAVFALDYALTGPALGTMKGPNWSYYAQVLAGEETLIFTWPVAAAVLVGLPFLLARGRPETRRFVGFTALFLLSSYLVYSVYFFQEARFLLPLTPLACVLAAAGAFAAATRMLASTRFRVLAALGPLLLVPEAARFGLRAAALKPSVVLAERSQAALQIGLLVPPASIVITGRDLLLLSGEAPHSRIVPLSVGQEWAGALAWRDRRRAKPSERLEETQAWVKGLDARPLEPGVARAMVAPPLGAALEMLLEDARLGTPLFLEGGEHAWSLLEPHFRKERIEAPMLELWRLQPLE